MNEMAEKHLKSRVIKILTILKRFYSLRELQEMLGIPFQALWKYINLSSLPEQETAEKILKKIREKMLIEKTLEMFMKEAKKEPLLLMLKPNFISFFSFLAITEMNKEKFDLIIPFSIASIPHATAVALETGALVCPILKEQPLIERGVLTFQVYNSVNNLLEIYTIPKSCFKQKPKVLIMDLILNDYYKVRSFVKEIAEGRVFTIHVLALKISQEIKFFLKENEINYKEVIKNEI